ncbi:hypothetical protein UPYG_G00092100 [Umbra pygmaea]|uniref:Centromere protein P n=1 Tax=Umbra pygmaea TaxID=75934 RepID=A0ABD0Y3G8_UMBPY
MNMNLEPYEAHIKVLQEEIAALQSQKEKNEREITMHLGGSMKNALLTMAGIETGAETRKSLMEIKAQLMTEIEELEEDLVRQTKMNGIALISCSVKTLEKSSSKLVQQYRLAGHCSSLNYQVEFVLSDVQVDAMSERMITDLNIIMEATEFKDFSTFVSRVEDNGDLLLFFRTIRRFSDMCEDRRRTFQHFQEKYPDVISLPGGCRSEVMLIQVPKLPGCSLTISWALEVTDVGEVIPKIDLVTKMPEKALQMDTRKVMDNAPESFQSLLKILGVEASIEALVQSVLLNM